MKNAMIQVLDKPFDPTTWVASKGAEPKLLSTDTIQGAIAELVHMATRGNYMSMDAWEEIVDDVSKIVGGLRGSKRTDFGTNTGFLFSCFTNKENGYIVLDPSAS